MTHNRWLVMLLVAGFAAGALGGCNAAKSAFNSGKDEAKQGNWDAAVVYFTRAAREDPGNIEYRMSLERALIEASKFHVQEARKYLAAEDLEKAIEEFTLAVQLDPSNQYARAELQETRDALTEREARRQEASTFEQRREQARQLLTTRPVLEPSSQAPINLRFAQDTSLQRIFEVLSTLSGINILFDEAFRDRRVTINLVDVSFQEALDKLVLINRLFYKVVDPSTIIIVPDNAQKHRQYDELVLRTFFVTNAEVNTVANMLRTIAGIQRVQPNPELLSITVRATPDQVAVAERIVELNDKSKSEIILDIEILEVDRDKLLQFGLESSLYSLGLTFDPAGSTTSEDGTATSVRLNRLASIDSSDWVVTFPSSLVYRLFKSNSEARLLASPKLRASEGEPARLNLGQEVPVPVTSFVAQTGTGGVPNTPVTSFQYRNVGINIEITPKVFVDGEIELGLSLETSTQLSTTVIAGIALPVFGTRQINNVVRLRDGETNVIGGLISQEDRNAVSGLPGIVDTPILNKIFSKNEQSTNQRDVVFSVTPQIIRAPRVSVEDLMALPMGTEQQITVPGAVPSPFPPVPPAEPAEEEGAGPGGAAAEPAEPAEPEEEPAAEPDEEPDEEMDEPEGAEEAEPPAAEPDEAAEVEPNQERSAESPPLGPITVVFSPPRSEIAAGERIELALIAGGAERLSSGSINLTFDPAALQVVDVQPGPFLTIDGKQISFVPFIDQGLIRVDFARENDPVGLRGSGHLLRLVLEALAPGTLTVSAAGIFQDPEGGAIPASFAAARIEVR
jgi:general secretion pathway protein D